MMKISLVCLLLMPFSFTNSFAQTNHTIDSLKHLIKTAKHDTSRLSAYLVWGEEIYITHPDSAIILWQQSQAISEKLFATKPNSTVVKTAKKYLAAALNNIGYIYMGQGDIPKALEYFYKGLEIREVIDDKKGIAESLNNLAFIYNQQGDIPKMMEYYKKSLKIYEEIGNKKGIAESLNNIGYVYNQQGDIPKSIEYHNKSLKIYEEIGDKQGIGMSFLYIGAIYDHQGDILKAIEYYKKGLKIQEELGDKRGQAISLNNLAVIYNNHNEISKAIDYFNKSLKIHEEIVDKKGIASSLNNIGASYNHQSEIKSNSSEKENFLKLAMDYYFRGLKIREEIGDKRGIAESSYNIGEIYFFQNNNKAKSYYKKSYQLSKELGYPESIEIAARGLRKMHEKEGNYQLAYEYYKEEILMHNSIQNKENYKKTQKQQAKYEYEKKAANDSIANVKEKEIKEIAFAKQKAELKAKRNQQYGLFGGLVLVLLFAGFVFNRLKVTQKQKHIIVHQKHLVEEKHKEITDSINYAERIQRSFLASTEMLDQHLKDYFVFFKPKDVVSGDFYWAGQLSNGNFAFSVADSTGHGVPGAIMSILNISSLEKSIEKETEPNAILNATRKIIIERLKKDGSAEGGKDGMDCSLLVFNKQRTQLWFAAANNAVFIIRDNVLIEYKADKMPVGKHERDADSFTLKESELKKGDIIYALTDGFPDQFGGVNGKKFMIKNLKELLVRVAHLPMLEQKQKLTDEFNTWKGENEQVDDVCVLGVRI